MSRRFVLRSTLFIVVIAALCVYAAVKFAVHSHRETMLVGDVSRTFHVYAPNQTGTAPRPLILVLHGLGGNGVGIERATGWDVVARRQGAVVVYPDAKGPHYGWNCGFVPSSYGSDADDVGFIRGLIARLRSEYPIDSMRIYIAGFSSGALMCYRLAADLSSTVAAIAPVAGTSGTLPMGSPTPSNPVSVIAFHGMRDNVVPFSGGVTVSSNDDARHWATFDHCVLAPATRSLRGGEVTMTDYRGGQNATEVELLASRQDGHIWPIGATETIWTFFAAHPRTQPSAPGPIRND